MEPEYNHQYLTHSQRYAVVVIVVSNRQEMEISTRKNGGLYTLFFFQRINLFVWLTDLPIVIISDVAHFISFCC